jgi:hypothetical protein
MIAFIELSGTLDAVSWSAMSFGMSNVAALDFSIWSRTVEHSRYQWTMPFERDAEGETLTCWGLFLLPCFHETEIVQDFLSGFLVLDQETEARKI